MLPHIYGSAPYLPISTAFYSVWCPHPPNRGAGTLPGSLAALGPEMPGGLSGAECDSTGHVCSPPGILCHRGRRSFLPWGHIEAAPLVPAPAQSHSPDPNPPLPPSLTSSSCFPKSPRVSSHTCLNPRGTALQGNPFTDLMTGTIQCWHI